MFKLNKRNHFALCFSCGIYIAIPYLFEFHTKDAAAIAAYYSDYKCIVLFGDREIFTIPEYNLEWLLYENNIKSVEQFKTDTEEYYYFRITSNSGDIVTIFHKEGIPANLVTLIVIDEPPIFKFEDGVYHTHPILKIGIAVKLLSISTFGTILRKYNKNKLLIKHFNEYRIQWLSKRVGVIDESTEYTTFQI